jgi:hypothetical protein
MIVQSGQERIERIVFGPFSPGDSLRVYRLQRQGIWLDLHKALAGSSSPLLQAWLAFLTQSAMGQPTYVLYDPHDGEAFVQVRYRPHQAAADIAYLAPSLAENERATRAWSQLLDGACIEAAGQGIQRVFANLPASSAEVDVFHQAGFGLYAGEDVYRLVDRPGQPAEALSPEPRLQQAEDWPALQKLCVAITPQRVRQAEGGIAPAGGRDGNCQRYVLPAATGTDLVGAITVCGGSMAHWLQVMLRPDAQDRATGLLQWGLLALADRPSRPIFCSVRQYQSGIQDVLLGLGFEPYASRALMVRHTVAWIKSPIPEAKPALKGGAEPVPPILPIDSEANLGNSDAR